MNPHTYKTNARCANTLVDKTQRENTYYFNKNHAKTQLSHERIIRLNTKRRKQATITIHIKQIEFINDTVQLYSTHFFEYYDALHHLAKFAGILQLALFLQKDSIIMHKSADRLSIGLLVQMTRK